ncbi:hypothetical protein ABH932_006180 [Streptacidiphilus sp. MAP5-52]
MDDGQRLGLPDPGTGGAARRDRLPPGLRPRGPRSGGPGPHPTPGGGTPAGLRLPPGTARGRGRRLRPPARRVVGGRRLVRRRRVVGGWRPTRDRRADDLGDPRAQLGPDQLRTLRRDRERTGTGGRRGAPADPPDLRRGQHARRGRRPAADGTSGALQRRAGAGARPRTDLHHGRGRVPQHCGRLRGVRRGQCHRRARPVRRGCRGSGPRATARSAAPGGAPKTGSGPVG